MRHGGELDNSAVEAAYARWAPVYDLVFTLIMAPGRKAAAAAAERARAASILDVGVGTGLELPYFAGQTTVVGVDLSEPMLRKCAGQRVNARGARSACGPAGRWTPRASPFPTRVDAVVAPYVMTVVPDPDRALDEFARVVKPGGEIVLVNHVGGRNPACGPA